MAPLSIRRNRQERLSWSRMVRWLRKAPCRWVRALVVTQWREDEMRLALTTLVQWCTDQQRTFDSI